MRYVDLFARITGLCAAIAGAALAGREFLVAAPGGIEGVGVAAPGTLSGPAVATVIVGAAFVLAGLVVLVGRGRSVAVSVGGAAAVVAMASLAIGVGPTAGILGIGVVALALLFAGASTDGHAAG